MTEHNMESRIVRYGDLEPCKTAFIDAHTPGSDRKENFTIIGKGVSESADQHVHLSIPHGFNIGAAGQPPRCRNSLHSHRTAEVFFVLSGRWRFFWGRWGDAGEVVLEEGDIFNIPTGIFRGFENIGTDYGMLMAILGGDDAGGGVIWAPEVIRDAAAHGLVLSEKGRLYDTAKGEALPAGEAPMPLLDDDALAKFPEPSTMAVIGGYVRRYQDMVAISDQAPVTVIGKSGIIRDRPGFEVRFLSEKTPAAHNLVHDHPGVLIPVKGHWQARWSGGKATLAPGDTISIPAAMAYELTPSMTGQAAIYQIIGTDDPAGPTGANNGG